MSLGANATHPVATILAVTPNDSTVLQPGLRGLYIGGAGDVSVVTRGGQTVTLTGLAVGMWHPIRVERVRATGTTATSILVGA